jgi:hypothetical protein
MFAYSTQLLPSYSAPAPPTVAGAMFGNGSEGITRPRRMNCGINAGASQNNGRAHSKFHRPAFSVDIKIAKFETLKT